MSLIKVTIDNIEVEVEAEVEEDVDDIDDENGGAE